MNKIKNFFKSRIFRPKLWQPFMFEDSKFIEWKGKVAEKTGIGLPNVWAFSFFIFVWCRGKIDDRVRRHETIHFQQQLECLFVGQWILYLLSYLKNRITMNNSDAYYNNIFELEAYEFDSKEDYLETRPRYAWIKYL